ncbi:MAG: galactose mutarotase [Clostridia bacterium]|nr:galactose mutarotase [Clostridia bacterium]
MIERRYYGKTKKGEEVFSYVLKDGGMEAEILSYGATLRRLSVPDREGNLRDVVLGYDRVAEYEENDGHLGGTVGRFANRIAHGTFALNGKTYTLAQNNGPHHLHGGDGGFDTRVWQAEILEDGVLFTLHSPDGDEGYPAALTVQVKFTLKDGALTLRYRAEAEGDTIVNLTNHAYFNLDGSETINDHILTLGADTFHEGDETVLPTGRILPVAGTPMDFTGPTRVGDGVESEEPCVKNSGGYDSNFVLSSSPAAVLYSEESGIVMTCTTDQPGIQLYSGNFLTDRKGKAAVRYGKRGGLCLETQHYPDSPNHPEWPTTVLKKGEVFESFTTYAFSVK